MFFRACCRLFSPLWLPARTREQNSKGINPLVNLVFLNSHLGLRYVLSADGGRRGLNFGSKLYKTFLVLIWFCGQAHKKRHKLSNRKFYVSSLLISNFSFLSICRTNANQTLSKCLHQTVEYIFRQDTNRQTRDLKPLLPHNY